MQCGLANLGSTCFLNACIQVLVATPSVDTFFSISDPAEFELQLDALSPRKLRRCIRKKKRSLTGGGGGGEEEEDEDGRNGLYFPEFMEECIGVFPKYIQPINDAVLKSNPRRTRTDPAPPACLRKSITTRASSSSSSSSSSSDSNRSRSRRKRPKEVLDEEKEEENEETTRSTRWKSLVDSLKRDMNAHVQSQLTFRTEFIDLFECMKSMNGKCICPRRFVNYLQKYVFVDFRGNPIWQGDQWDISDVFLYMDNVFSPSMKQNMYTTIRETLYYYDDDEDHEQNKKIKNEADTSSLFLLLDVAGGDGGGGGGMTLRESLDRYTAREKMEGVKDDRGVDLENAFRQVTVKRFPTILCILLKRFHGNGGLGKNDSLFTFPLQLESRDLDKFSAQSPYTCTYTYHLFAVCFHLGPGLNDGHYTCMTKHQATDKWIYYDDASVWQYEGQPIRHGRTTIIEYNAHEKAFSSNAVYCVFYHQIKT